MLTETEKEDLLDAFDYLEDCCLHEAQFTPAEVDSILAYGWMEGGWKRELCLTGNDGQGFAVARLKNGRYGLITASADYTGHGCQCGSMTVVADTLPEIVSHLETYTYGESDVSEHEFAAGQLREKGLLPE